jgi:hypothetical protein
MSVSRSQAQENEFNITLLLNTVYDSSQSEGENIQLIAIG